MSDVFDQFQGTASYIASDELRHAVNVAVALARPLLVRGEPGTGKTLLAENLATALHLPLIRWHVKSTTKAKDGLYVYDTVARLHDSRFGDSADVRDIARYIKLGPLGEALAADSRVVLLIDEIDKADAEFEAFLLELLSDFQVTVPELGTLKAKHLPLVILTSNNAREMSDALKRRCLHLYIDFPDKEQELRIIKTKIPDVSDNLAEQIVQVIQSLRKLDLKKIPGISESLDWVKALTLLNVKTLDEALVNETLDTIVKYEGDVRKAQEELKDYVEKSRARRGGGAPTPAAGGRSDKDFLN